VDLRVSVLEGSESCVSVMVVRGGVPIVAEPHFIGVKKCGRFS
jgi:hypothetical protein